MDKTRRTCPWPLPINRFPDFAPESRLMGAAPTRFATSPRLSVPSSGSSARNVEIVTEHVIGPTPLTGWRKGGRHRRRSQSPFLRIPCRILPHRANRQPPPRGGACTKGTALETCVFSHSVRKPQAASPTWPSSLSVMWLRREPNNLSKPPISPSMRVNPREHPCKTRPFAVRIKPDFSDEFSVRIFTRMMT